MHTQTVIVIGIRNVAKYLGISRTTVYRLMEKQEFPPCLGSTGQKKSIKAWKKADIDAVKSALKPPGRPVGYRKPRPLQEKVLDLERQNRDLRDMLLQVQRRVLGGKSR